MRSYRSGLHPLTVLLYRACPSLAVRGRVLRQRAENQAERRPHDELCTDRCDAEVPQHRGRKLIRYFVDSRQYEPTAAIRAT